MGNKSMNSTALRALAEIPGFENADVLLERAAGL